MDIKNKINPKIILFSLTLIGFLLRLRAALNLDVVADDMLYASQSAGILSAKILSTHSNPPLFFYLTDLAYTIFGYTTLASRFWPLVCGTLLIPLIFLIVFKLTNNVNWALWSSLFTTGCSFLIRMTFSEQSLVVLFFVSVGIWSGLNYIDNYHKKWLIISAIGFGLGFLTKYSAPFFIFSFFLYYIFQKKSLANTPNFRKKIKDFMIFSVIILFFISPVIFFNYFIYREKGIVDVYTSRIIKINKTQDLYSGLAGQGESFFQRIKTLGSYNQYNLPLYTDPLLVLAAICGISMLFYQKSKTNYRVLRFTGINIIIPFILQSGGSGLAKHFAFIHFFLAIPSGYIASEAWSKIKNKIGKVVFLSSLIIFMLISLGTYFGTPQNYFSESATSQVKSFIQSSVSNQDLLILDSRIYSAKNFWFATPNGFITTDQFPQLYNQIAKIDPKFLHPLKVYILECRIDDCGWGWVKTNKEFNDSTEKILSTLTNNALIVKKIYAKQSIFNEVIFNSPSTEEYRIYSLTINLPYTLIEEVKKNQEFYFTPYLYKNMDQYLFNYTTRGFTSIIESVNLWIIYCSILLTFFIIIYLIMMLNNISY